VVGRTVVLNWWWRIAGDASDESKKRVWLAASVLPFSSVDGGVDWEEPW